MILNTYHHELRPQESPDGRFLFPFGGNCDASAGQTSAIPIRCTLDLLPRAVDRERLPRAHRQVRAQTSGYSGEMAGHQKRNVTLYSVTADVRAFQREVSDIARKQVPFALALSLNDAAKDGLQAVETEIEEAFDNPMRFTRKAFFVRRANKKTLAATIERKPKASGRHYLEVEEEGGPRPQTGFEKLLASRMKGSGTVRAVVPTKKARKTSYGNWSPGQRNQVLAALQAQRGQASKPPKGSGKGKSKRAGYFTPRAGSKLSPGIYQRMAKGRVKKIAHITDKAARYQPRFGFHSKVKDRVAQTLPDHFARRFAQAMATRR